MNVEQYLLLPYHISVVRDQDDAGEVAWVSSVDELPGCISQGDTPEEALTMIREAMEAWLAVAMAHGDPIPEPRRPDTYSGHFVLRVPAGLHQQLDLGAKREGTSLNQYASTLLAGAVGWSGELLAERQRVPGRGGRSGPRPGKWTNDDDE